MTDPTDQLVWIDRLSRRMEAVADCRQRQALFLEAVVPVSPGVAGDIVETILRLGIRRRDVKSLLLVETAMLALANGNWPLAHRSVICDAAEEKDNDLIRLLFDGAEKRKQQDDDEPFPVPDYVGGRPLTLGERRSLAAGPDRRLLEMATRDPHPMVVSRVLDNPRITERDVIFIAARRPAPVEALREVGVHPRWRLSKRVARALIMNPYTPSEVSITLLHTTTSAELHEVMDDLRLPIRLRRVARELFRRFG